MVLRLWLLWQSTILCLLVLSVFFGYRTHLQVSKMRLDITMIRDLLVAWSSTFGQDVEVVRAALERVVSERKWIQR